MAFSSAVVAGIAIGSALAAIILTAGTCLYFRPPRETEPQTRERGEDVPDSEEERVLRAYLSGKMEQFLPNSKFVELKHLRDDFSEYVGVFVTHHLDPDRPASVDLSPFIAAAGDLDDWKLLQDPSARRSVVLHQFVCRVMCSRISVDGDPKTTLLPPDLLAAYQRCTKMPTEKLLAANRDDGFPEQITENIPIMMRHYWRALAVHFGSVALPAEAPDQHGFVADDPRLANLAATKELLRAVLAPFERPGRELAGEEVSGFLNTMMRRLLNMGLLAFAEPKPVEFFWPEAAERREGLRCFGISTLTIVPGSYSSTYGGTPERRVVAEPVDDEYAAQADRALDYATRTWQAESKRMWARWGK